MNKERYYRLFLRVTAVSWMLLLIGWLVMLAGVYVTDPDHWLSRGFLWYPRNLEEEAMIAVIYFVWGIFLWRASSTPYQHVLFMKFTVWANLAHGILMMGMAFLQSHHHGHFCGDGLILSVQALIIYIFLKNPFLVISEVKD